jgi:DNA-binding MarR family transcriptional regulator
LPLRRDGGNERSRPSGRQPNHIGPSAGPVRRIDDMTGEDPVTEDPRRGTLSWGFFDDCVGPVAFLLSHALTNRSHAALAPFGLPAGSLSLLILIHANPNCSQADLSRATGMSQSGVVSILDELEGSGLAARSQWPGDRRRNKLSLTAKGEAQFHEMVAVQIAQEDSIREEFSTGELRQLIAFLRRAYAAVAKDKPSA